MASRYKTLYFPKADHPLFPGRKWVAEHRVVMAEKLGRTLLRSEIVHHKDEDGFNNRRRNLKLLPWGVHSRLHNKGRKQSAATRRKKSRAMKGRRHSAAHLKNMSLARLGKKQTEGAKEKLRALWRDPAWRAKQIRGYNRGWKMRWKRMAEQVRR